MNKQEIEKAIGLLKVEKANTTFKTDSRRPLYDIAISALTQQLPKKVYHFLEDDTFETTCCGTDVTNKDYKYCPECGCLLGEVEEVFE